MDDDSYLRSKEETIKRYLETGDIGSFIMMDATLAMCSAEGGWSNDRRPVIARFEQKWIKVYARVHADVEAICRKCKEWELIHWMGFAPDDVKELLKLHDEWEHLDWENATEERREFLRNLWAPDPCCDELPAWGPYFARRVKKPICDAHDWDHFSGVTKSAKIMLGSSAGRVILTVQDRYNRGDPKSAYDGAHLTMIFDGTSEYPRGVLEGLCASREEALGLVQEAIDNMPVMKQDDQVFIV